ncbi:MAG: ABC transporter permease [Bacteroidales bacterium]|nr:ABC transporter permease [Bacteroidales bacterium]
MLNYFIRKIAYSVFVFLGVVTAIFFLFNVLPGDSSRMLMGQRSDISSLEAIRADLGLNQPLYVRYIKYLDDLSPISGYSKNSDSFFYFDTTKYKSTIKLLETKTNILVIKPPYLQRSFQSKKDVSEILKETFGNTFILALAAIVLASVIGIVLGVLAAIFKSSVYDKSIIVFTSFGMSLPSFFAAILMAWLLAFKWGEYTHLNITGNFLVLDDYGVQVERQWRNIILPAITLGIRPLSVVLQLARNSMLEVLSQDYIRTARAKGLNNRTIIYKHALKNAMNPVITSISGWLASMMAGVVFVEFIFGWKGLGYVIVEGVNNYDIPVVMGVVLLISIIFVIITLLVDLIYVKLDPRVKY